MRDDVHKVDRNRLALPACTAAMAARYKREEEREEGLDVQELHVKCRNLCGRVAATSSVCSTGADSACATLAALPRPAAGTRWLSRTRSCCCLVHDETSIKEGQNLLLSSISAARLNAACCQCIVSVLLVHCLRKLLHCLWCSCAARTADPVGRCWDELTAWCVLKLELLTYGSESMGWQPLASCKCFLTAATSPSQSNVERKLR